MRPHWKCAKLVLETLAMKIGPMDENGLDVLFAIGCGNYKKENVKGFDIPSTFRSAMELAEAPHEKDMYQTPMAQALLPILTTHKSDMSKKLTIIVLTTGEWEGQPDDVERVVATNIEKMCQEKPDFQTERWFTMEFVSFGDNEAALQRLGDLDNKMQERFGIP